MTKSNLLALIQVIRKLIDLWTFDIIIGIYVLKDVDVINSISSFGEEDIVLDFIYNITFVKQQLTQDCYVQNKEINILHLISVVQRVRNKHCDKHIWIKVTNYI